MLQNPPVNIQKDIEQINRISIVPSLLNVICRTTGMGFAAIARVTEDQWVACSVQDEINFGLKPGGELKLETTICNEIRQSGRGVIIDHVEKDEHFRAHHTPLTYGFQSYISIPIRRKDGSFFGTLCAIDPRPAKLNTPAIIGMFELFADLISFHLHTLEELDNTEAKLSEERRVSDLREQFIAVLGHDLRNPLGAVSASVQLLLQTPLNKDAMILANIIKNSSYRIQGLVDNVLDFARGRLGGGITLNLVEDDQLENILNHVIAEMRVNQPGKVIEVNLNLPGKLSYDSKRIAQLFSNLLSNALNHGKPDSPVTIVAENKKGEFILSITNASDKIPDAVMNRLFKPFARGDGKLNQQGLGLGLFIASEIALAHGGTIDAMSSETEARFTFRMPRK